MRLRVADYRSSTNSRRRWCIVQVDTDDIMVSMSFHVWDVPVEGQVYIPWVVQHRIFDVLRSRHPVVLHLQLSISPVRPGIHGKDLEGNGIEGNP